MKKTFLFGLMAVAMFATTGVALAADAATAVPTDATSSAMPVMVPTSAMAPMPTDQNSMPMPSDRMPMMRQNVMYRGGEWETMGGQQPGDGMALGHIIVGGITILLFWALMVSAIIALCKWSKKQGK